MGGKPTLDWLERRMRAVLKDRRTRVRFTVSYALAGQMRWEGDGDQGPLLVELEPFNNGLLGTLVHELAHYVLRREARRWGELEESFVLGLEREMEERIKASPRRWKWWREALFAKLSGGLNE